MEYRLARVNRVRRVTPHMMRVSLAGEDLRKVDVEAPDAYVKLFFPREGEQRPVLPPLLTDDVTSWYRTYLQMPDDIRPPMRTYTIRAHRGDEVDIDFVLHGDTGPAGKWACRAKPGDHVAFVGPAGLHSPPEDTDWQLLVGDETALPAIGAIVDGLPRGALAHVYVEIDGPAEEQRLTTAGDVRITWVHRTGGHGTALLDTVRAAVFPGGKPYAWISGESGLVKHVRRHLVRDRGFDKRAITFTGYWRLGVNQEDDSRESLRQYDLTRRAQPQGA